MKIIIECNDIEQAEKLFGIFADKPTTKGNAAGQSDPGDVDEGAPLLNGIMELCGVDCVETIKNKNNYSIKLS